MRQLFNFPLILTAILCFGFAKAPSTNHNTYSLKSNVSALPNGLLVSRFEVSNAEYKEFLLGVIEEGNVDQIARYVPDATVWQVNENLAKYGKEYFAHSMFSHHPVVGISHEAAKAFCAWKTRRYGGQVVEKGRYPHGQYRFRLPTKAEWELAATPQPQTVYAGGFEQVKDKKGHLQFNHRLSPEEFEATEGEVPLYERLTAAVPVRAYPAAENGVYHLAGNAAEMVAEPGIAKGGSWDHLAEEGRVEKQLMYSAPAHWLGFRYVMERVN